MTVYLIIIKYVKIYNYILLASCYRPELLLYGCFQDLCAGTFGGSYLLEFRYFKLWWTIHTFRSDQSGFKILPEYSFQPTKWFRSSFHPMAMLLVIEYQKSRV